jgi:hypothetical protein
VLLNDTDDDSSLPWLTAIIERAPAHGVLVLNADGAFTYTPVASFSGVDTFTYRTKDTSPVSQRNLPATVSITVRDVTPPLVTLTVPVPNGKAGYFVTSPVMVSVSATDASRVMAFACTDNGAPIVPGSLVGIGTVTATGSLGISADGTHSLSCSATDGSGTSGAASGSSSAGTVKIDTARPIVTNTAPANNATYLLNQSVALSYTCNDPSPGSGLAANSCIGSAPSGSNLNTTAVGPRLVTVTATDNAGNTTTNTATFYIAYQFVLAPPKTPANLGSAVPLTWQLKDANGVATTDLTSLITLTSYFTPGVLPVNGVCPIVYPGTVKAQLYNPASGATGGSNFRSVRGGFQFNWDTTTAQATGKGCYTLVWQFKDRSGPAPAYDVLDPSLLAKASVQLK